MKKLALFATTLVAGAVLASSAFAVDIVNQDKTNHDVRILLANAPKGTKPTQVKVAAGATVQFDCSKGCVAHIGKKDDPKKDVTLKGGEKQLVIKDNKLTAVM
jgi:hypothetical protein